MCLVIYILPSHWQEQDGGCYRYNQQQLPVGFHLRNQPWREEAEERGREGGEGERERWREVYREGEKERETLKMESIFILRILSLSQPFYCLTSFFILYTKYSYVIKVT